MTRRLVPTSRLTWRFNARRERVLDRIAEVTADVDADEIREGFERLRSALDTYRVAIEETQGIILDTPGLDGQALGYDERIVDWYDCVLAALDSLDGEFVKPGLTSLGAYKAAQHV
jgi:hypothetical protein